MDNFRRINFLTKDEINATPFNTELELCGKKIRKIYVPGVKINNFYGDGDIEANALYQTMKDFNGNPIHEKKGLNIWSIRDLGTFKYTSDPYATITYTPILEVYNGSHLYLSLRIKSTTGISCMYCMNPYVAGNSQNSVSVNDFSPNTAADYPEASVESYLKYFNKYFNSDLLDIPYLCIDVLDITINGVLAAYIEYTNDSTGLLNSNSDANKPIISSTYFDQYQLYYEEYQE